MTDWATNLVVELKDTKKTMEQRIIPKAKWKETMTSNHDAQSCWFSWLPKPTRPKVQLPLTLHLHLLVLVKASKVHMEIDYQV